MPCQPCARLAAVCRGPTKSDHAIKAPDLARFCVCDEFQSFKSRIERADCSTAPCKLRGVRNGRVVEVMCRAATFSAFQSRDFHGEDASDAYYIVVCLCDCGGSAVHEDCASRVPSQVHIRCPQAKSCAAGLTEGRHGVACW